MIELDTLAPVGECLAYEVNPATDDAGVLWALTPSLMLYLGISGGASDSPEIYVGWVCPRDAEFLRSDSVQPGAFCLAGCEGPLAQPAGSIDADLDYPEEDFIEFLTGGLEAHRANPLATGLIADGGADLLTHLAHTMLRAQADKRDLAATAERELRAKLAEVEALTRECAAALAPEGEA